MERDNLNQRLIQAKRNSGLKWSDIAEAIGRSPGWTISALFGQHDVTVKEAQSLGSLLKLTAEETEMLCRPAVRGASAPLNDPLIHRLHEMFNVNGAAIKQLIMEEFGDGVVSAIDFKFHVKRVPHPDGDRAQITLDGKFLPFTPW
uniref:Cyanate hydratase n=1 Tax=Strigamia maritima TaxID=126957 RepID=T1J2H9_STRMM